MHDLTQKFVDALEHLHRDRDVQPLVELFGDDATLTKAGLPQTHRGKEGAREFWQQYRDDFESVDASFHHTVTDDGIAYLEWTSSGSLKSGKEFRYDGVSVLQGSEDAIDGFRTYYDTTAFLPAGAQQ